jgi:hypothetical protein
MRRHSPTGVWITSNVTTATIRASPGTPHLTYNHDALNATARPIPYACNWGDDKPWEGGSSIANSWRMSGDIYGK